MTPRQPKTLQPALHPRAQDEHRARINTSKLIDFLQNHAVNGKGGKNIQSRVAAARILLNKTLPDLHAAELTGSGGGPVIAKLEVSFVGAHGASV